MRERRLSWTCRSFPAIGFEIVSQWSGVFEEVVVVLLQFVHELEEVVEFVALLTTPAATVVEVVPVEIEEVGGIESLRP